MLRAALYRFTGSLPCRIIRGEDDEPYLERYYLATLLGVRIYVHRFVASDPDRGLHDHPWAWAASWILVGRYDELYEHAGQTCVAPRRRFTFNRFGGDHRHRVLLPEGAEAWTLFLHGPRVKGWSFFDDGQVKPVTTSAAEHETSEWWRRAPKGREVRT